MKPVKNHPYLFCTFPGAILAVAAFFAIVNSEDSSPYLVIALFCGLGAMLLAPVLLLLLRSLRQKRKESRLHQKYLQYRELYLTDVKIEDPRFGTCIFEKDTNKHTLKLKQCPAPAPFGDSPLPRISIDIPEADVEKAFRALEHVYDRQQTFTAEFHQEVKEFCDEWEETDSQGAPVSLNLIRQNSSITDISIGRSFKGDLTASLKGSVTDDAGRDLLGCHSVVLRICCETGEREFDLEG